MAGTAIDVRNLPDAPPEDIAICVDTEIRGDATSGPQATDSVSAASRLDALRQAVLSFAHCKLALNPQHAIAVISLKEAIQESQGGGRGSGTSRGDSVASSPTLSFSSSLAVISSSVRSLALQPSRGEQPQPSLSCQEQSGDAAASRGPSLDLTPLTSLLTRRAAASRAAGRTLRLVRTSERGHNS